MTDTVNSELDYDSTGTVPYTTLYIYYLQGHIDSSRFITGVDFIGNWEEDEFSFLFFTRPADDMVNTLLQNQPHLLLLDQYQMSYEEWLGEKPAVMDIGRFRIIPAWETPDTLGRSGTYDVRLDPGVVFGTGTHPTTHDCLEAIAGLCYGNRIRTVLDLGTGTGLLAIAACKLGCQRALALDLNFLAAKTALRNIHLNRLQKNIIVLQARAEDFIDRPADLMISNIHHAVMKKLVQSEALLNHRWFILSGLLRSQVKDVVDCLEHLPVKIVKRWDRNGIWHTLLGKRCE